MEVGRSWEGAGLELGRSWAGAAKFQGGSSNGADQATAGQKLVPGRGVGELEHGRSRTVVVLISNFIKVVEKKNIEIKKDLQILGFDWLVQTVK